MTDADLAHVVMPSADPVAARPESPLRCPERTAPPAPAGGRPPADRFMRRLLGIRDHPEGVTERQVSRLFETSILISAVRCTLAYVVFPIFAPALYAASSWGPVIGVVIGAVALVFDVLSIRRFWIADHRWRWRMTAIYACVIPLVTILVVSDVARLV